jgi:RNA polymerase sigma-70 factor (ECF subfamily)
VQHPGEVDESARSAFDAFVRTEGSRLRRVLVAHYGLDVGPEVASDALAWAWENWARVREMANPSGYLYRVAQSSARRHWRWRRALVLPPERVPDNESAFEPKLEQALLSLKRSQRVAVILVYGLGWTYTEAAESMNVPVTTVRNHLARGMARLRREIGEVE